VRALGHALQRWPGQGQQAAQFGMRLVFAAGDPGGDRLGHADSCGSAGTSTLNCSRGLPAAIRPRSALIGPHHLQLAAQRGQGATVAAQPPDAVAQAVHQPVDHGAGAAQTAVWLPSVASTAGRSSPFADAAAAGPGSRP
jgi:hypothetical protein